MTVTSSSSLTSPHAKRNLREFFAMALAIAVFEGYDLSVYGATIPALLHRADWHMSTAGLGTVGALTSIGMLLGAAVVGAAGGRVSPRTLLLTGLVAYSLSTLGSAVAPAPGFFVGTRFFAGTGLGAVMPVLQGTLAELSPPTRRSRNITCTMAGICLGAVAAPLLGSVLMPEVSYHVMYLIGALPLVLIAPWGLLRLPDSPLRLMRAGRQDEAVALARRYGLPAPGLPARQEKQGRLGLSALITHPHRRMTLPFWIMSFCAQLVSFGLGTWLPTILKGNGYTTGTALALTSVAWIGAAGGLIPGGVFADRAGPRRIVVTAFLAGAGGLLVISAGPPVGLLYACLLVCGFGLLGEQGFISAYLVNRMPAEVRTSALGWALSIGRLGAVAGPAIGGFILSAGGGMRWNFYVLAAVAGVGMTAALAVPRRSPDESPLRDAAPSIVLGEPTVGG
ncbi:MFS transporter [Streptomyces sp. NPDC048288]|uniref:MFS transporter n=1 Tax=Streptomyces sp. NPDC048288 TaxID=3365529 RepID=UPI003711A154